MANLLYPKAKEALLKGDLDMDGSIKMLLCDAAEISYNAAHDNLDDLAGAGIISTSAALASKTFTNGVFSSDPASFTGVSGDQFEVAIMFLDTGTPATSKLIGFWDTGLSGFPATPSGGNYTLAPDNTDEIWFEL